MGGPGESSRTEKYEHEPATAARWGLKILAFTAPFWVHWVTGNRALQFPILAGLFGLNVIAGKSELSWSNLRRDLAQGTLILTAFAAWVLFDPLPTVLALGVGYAGVATSLGRNDLVRTIEVDIAAAVLGLTALVAFAVAPEDPVGPRIAAATGLAYFAGAGALERTRRARGTSVGWGRPTVNLVLGLLALGLGAGLYASSGTVGALLASWRGTAVLAGAGASLAGLGFLADRNPPAVVGLALLSLALGKALIADVWALPPGKAVVAVIGLVLAGLGLLVAFLFALPAPPEPDQPPEQSAGDATPDRS